MNKPHLYTKTNSLPKEANKKTLDEFFRKMTWNGHNERVADIGCGPGDVTSDILYSYFPPNIEKLVGFDISTEMVEYARLHNRNPKISYELLDIETEELPEKFKGYFDHVFSFICLHWVVDQKTAYTNIFTLLKPKGDILISYLKAHPILEAYEILERNLKWKPYFYDIKRCVGPFMHSKSPQDDLKRVIKSVGFEIKACSHKNWNHVYPSLDCFLDMVNAVSPFHERVPKEERLQFSLDFQEALLSLNIVFYENNKKLVRTPYEFIIIVAQKNY